MSKESTSSGGIGLAGLLGVAFVVLKLCHVINWSWWWVTAPFWGGLAIALAVMLVVGTVALVAVLLEDAQTRKRRKAAKAVREFGNALNKRY